MPPAAAACQPIWGQMRRKGASAAKSLTDCTQVFLQHFISKSLTMIGGGGGLCGEEGTSSGLPPSPKGAKADAVGHLLHASGRGEGTALGTPSKLRFLVGGFTVVPSPALSLEKVPKGRMRSFSRVTLPFCAATRRNSSGCHRNLLLRCFAGLLLGYEGPVDIFKSSCLSMTYKKNEKLCEFCLTVRWGGTYTPDH